MAVTSGTKNRSVRGSAGALQQLLVRCPTCSNGMQGIQVPHEIGWAHMNLKPSKVQVKQHSDGSYHCTITDLGSSISIYMYWLKYCTCGHTVFGLILHIASGLIISNVAAMTDVVSHFCHVAGHICDSVSWCYCCSSGIRLPVAIGHCVSLCVTVCHCVSLCVTSTCIRNSYHSTLRLL